MVLLCTCGRKSHSAPERERETKHQEYQKPPGNPDRERRHPFHQKTKVYIQEFDIYFYVKFVEGFSFGIVAGTIQR